jgi:hypothetical protein
MLVYPQHVPGGEAEASLSASGSLSRGTAMGVGLGRDVVERAGTALRSLGART